MYLYILYIYIYIYIYKIIKNLVDHKVKNHRSSVTNFIKKRRNLNSYHESINFM